MQALVKDRPKTKEQNVIDEAFWIVADSDITTNVSPNGANKKAPHQPNGQQKSTILNHPHPLQLEDPFYYGWRYEFEELPDGTFQRYKVALPPERFLDPQMGDYFVQSENHDILTDSIRDSYANFYDGDDTVKVLNDVKILWGIPGLSEPTPDLAIIPNITKEDKYSGAFDTTEQETRPMLLIEVTSPRYPFDKDKIPIYEQAGVQEYIIIDPHWGSNKNELEFFGYTLVDGSYEPMVKDEQGRLYSATTNTHLYFEEGAGNKVIAYITDGTTGERILDNRGSHRDRLIQAIGRRYAEQLAKKEEAKRKAAEEQAREAAEMAKAEAAQRQAAEDQAKAEAVQRQAAEDQAKAEAAQRQVAEDQVKAEAVQRQAAEDQIKAEVAQRQAVEEAMAQAQAEIARLQAQLAKGQGS